MKVMNSNKYVALYVSKFLVICCTLLAVILFAPTSRAIIKESVYGGAGEVSPGIDISRTTLNVVAGLSTDAPLAILTGRNGDMMYNCGLMFEVDSRGEAAVISEIQAAWGMTESEARQHVETSLNFAQGYPDGVCDFEAGSPGSYSNGSMLGLVNRLDKTIRDPIPVNLAYFVKDYATRIPLVRNTAYAQSVTYTAPGLSVVLDIWKVVRNVAYGAIAVSMLVIGIMIMTRRKINPQTVVTVQNALPRVVLALVLITFSYPIGAALASIAYYSVGVVNFILSNFAATTEVIDNSVFAMSTRDLFTYLGAGFFGGVLAIAGLAVYVIVLLVALIRGVLIYARIVLSIITAPIQFAVGAIPGKEDAIGNWFKGVLANVLAIPAMVFMIRLGVYFLGQYPRMTLQTNPGAIIFQGNFNSLDFNAWSLLFLPLLAILVLSLSVRMPGMVRDWISGGDKKR